MIAIRNVPELDKSSTKFRFGRWRHLVAPVLAVGVTVSLLLVMTTLISEEFTPQDTIELAAFEINAKPDDTVLIKDRKPPPRPDIIDVPPPPPAVEIPQTRIPSEPIVGTAQPGPVLDLEAFIVPTRYDMAIQDGDPAPLVRIPPVMPPRAMRSGHCRVAFDIGADGRPFNVRASYCSQSLFQRAAEKSVGKWTYRPEIRDGLPVARTGFETRIRFDLRDERGDVIPE
ncbi:energy transducer TonB [uncultured Algimonas sp.]|uniref:energy transducer TonB n=1 Tax=uncultured Algimonas sp. TaxID=1547920 RepID=UPI002614F615|nr:energy transducer TonB [uncultured Algimonas sp.]